MSIYIHNTLLPSTGSRTTIFITQKRKPVRSLISSYQPLYFYVWWWWWYLVLVYFRSVDVRVTTTVLELLHTHAWWQWWQTSKSTWRQVVNRRYVTLWWRHDLDILSDLIIDGTGTVPGEVPVLLTSVTFSVIHVTATSTTFPFRFVTVTSHMAGLTAAVKQNDTSYNTKS